MILSRSIARANMIPETALVLSLVLLVLFGLIQLSLITYAQAAGDAAAFVGGHSVIQTKANASSADTSTVRALIANVFPHLAITNASVTNPTSNTLETDIMQSPAQFAFPLTGTPIAVAQNSRSVEARQGSTATGDQLTNYCANSTLGSNFGNRAIATFQGSQIGQAISSPQVSVTSSLDLSGITVRDSTYQQIASLLNALPGQLNTLNTTSVTLVAALQNPIISAGVTAAAAVNVPLLSGIYTSTTTNVNNSQQMTANTILSALQGGVSVPLPAGAPGAPGSVTVASTTTSIATTQQQLVQLVTGLNTVSATVPGLPAAIAQLNAAINPYTTSSTATDTTLTAISTQEAGLLAQDPAVPISCPVQ